MSNLRESINIAFTMYGPVTTAANLVLFPTPTRYKLRDNLDASLATIGTAPTAEVIFNIIHVDSVGAQTTVGYLTVEANTGGYAFSLASGDKIFEIGDVLIFQTPQVVSGIEHVGVTIVGDR